MKISCLLFAVLTASITFAAIPSGYYDDAAGLSGNDLRLALHNIIDGHTVKTYDQVWAAFATTDLKANGKIWDMYTGIEFTYAVDQQSNDGEVYTVYNREHSWPKSWANESVPMVTDIFHLYPTQAYANSYRNNNAYGEVGASVTYTTQNGSKLGQARTGLGFVGTVFEPIDEYKGDLARTYFYMSTRYYTEDAGWDVSDMTDKCELKDWAVSMLLNWHNDDPVSRKELDRIEAVYAIQVNRNPFIDHPEYVDSIWNAPAATFGAPTAQTASSIQSNGFTANWSAVGSATGYKLFISESSDFSSHISGYGPYDAGDVQSKIVSGLASSVTHYYRVMAYKVGEESGNSNIITVMTTAPVGSVDSTKIFFSEYIEGSTNKALEIFNNSGDDIDLGKITMKLYSNAATSPSQSLTLSGTLLNNEVYVVAHPDADAMILAEADLTNSSVVNFNGNDAIELYYNDTLVDIIGVVSTSETYFAQDVTLVRKADVTCGNTTYTEFEWNSYGEDEFSYLGSHTISEAPTSIALQEFKALYISGRVILHWTTASETENAAFQIFRNNEFIASVEGSGTTSVTKYYEYIDKFISPGKTYIYLLNDIDYSGNINSHNAMSVTISTSGEGYQLLPEGSIGVAYPNPFNPTTTLPISLKETAVVSITLHDVFGRKQRDIINKQFSPGEYTIPINVSDLPSAVYFLHVYIGNSMKTQKIVLSK
jgi:endonuclease I